MVIFIIIIIYSIIIYAHTYLVLAVPGVVHYRIHDKPAVANRQVQKGVEYSTPRWLGGDIEPHLGRYIAV